MKIKENVSLKTLNTFGVEAIGKYYAEANNEDEARQIFADKLFINNPNLILGGGSNILFTKDFDGIVIKNNIKGFELVNEDKDYVYVRAGAGEIWHEFVVSSLNKGWSGIENLSLIPGSVGASPMQNIGAYGVEIKEVFHELEAIDLQSGEIKYFGNSDCKFGYRESVFKNELKNKFMISRVTYRLNKNPKLNTSYGAIETELNNMKIQSPTPIDVSQAVINIRSSKLPNPKEIGNAGSFFKNPVIPTRLFDDLKKEFPEIVGYKVDEENTKVAAGWLIDNDGWKGKTFSESFGVHKNQALVLVNYGGANGNQIFDLSSKIIDSIKSKYGIELHREVNIY